MLEKPALQATLLCFLIHGAGAATPALADFPIAGVRPYQRLEGAPVINEVDKAPGWYEHALTGVSRPYPVSLRFLEDQGNWYTPFNRPGMTAPYDIRGWHNK
jgi:hypothetical protein